MKSIALSVLTALICVASSSMTARAEGNLAPIGVNSNNLIAQVAAPPQFIPTDTTPFTLNPERNSFNPGYKFKLFQALPERLWFNASAETSQRLDTNVLFTARNPKADYAFRTLPNITAGYNIAKNTSMYVNYFVIKDSFAKLPFLNRPTTQSLSWGIQHNKRLGDKTNLQYNFQARELWQARNLHQFDFIPGVTLTHSLTPRSILYASVLLQMRGQSYFVAPTRELDPFYTVGYIRGFGPWTLIATDTLVTNFRHPTFKFSVPNQSNVTMIADIEVNRPIVKRFPSMLAFVRAEPVFNWGAHRTPGLSGFDFRLYGGMRIIVSKPSYYGATQDLKKQLMKQGGVPSKMMKDGSQATDPSDSSVRPGTTPGINPNSNPVPVPTTVPPASSSIPDSTREAHSADASGNAFKAASTDSSVVVQPNSGFRQATEVPALISPVNFIPGQGELQ